MNKFKYSLTTALLAATSVIAVTACNPSSGNISNAQKAEIEKIVHDYIVNNASVILDAVNAMEEQARQDSVKQLQARIDQNYSLLANDPHAPVVGNTDGKSTVIEFFDYNCPYCKKMYPVMMQVIEKNKDVRWVLHDMPILSPSSKYATAMAFAAKKQGKYLEFHRALMEHNGRLEDAIIDELATKSGLDLAEAKKYATSEEVINIVKERFDMSQKVGVNGVPMFIVNGKIVGGGAVPLEDLEKALEAK